MKNAKNIVEILRGSFYLAHRYSALSISTFRRIRSIKRYDNIKTYEILEYQLTNLFENYSVDLQQLTEIQEKIKNQYRILCLTLIPAHLRYRALHERELLKSMQ